MAQTTLDDAGFRPAAQAEDAPLLDRALDLTRIGLEPLAWLLLTALALLLRVIWLHGWPMQAQEAAVATSMWGLLAHGEVAAPPADAGPVATLLGALWLALFGVNDDIARLGPALIGAATVAACWWLRPFLSRAGALLAALLLSWSPLALYSARRLVAEPYAAFFLLVLAICLLRLWTGGDRRALFVAAGAFILAIFSHYLALPFALLLIVVTPLAVRLARGARAEAETTRPRVDAAPTDDQALRAPRLTSRDRLTAAGIAAGLAAVIGLLAASGGSGLLGSLLSPVTGWLGAAGERPAVALPLLLLVYEPLLLVTAVAGAWMLGSGRESAAQRLAGLLIAIWSIAALLLASLAGDRDPAQLVYAVVPLALLAGRVLGGLVTSIPWATYRQRGGPILSAISALALVAIVVSLNMLVAPTRAGSAPFLVTLLLDLALAAALVGATIWLARPFGWPVGGRILALTLLGLFGLYAVRSATQLAYVQPASAVEMAVHDQTAPGVLAVVDRIHRLSRDVTGLRRTNEDVTGGHGLEIALDRALAQPFAWYLRDYPQRMFFDPSRGVPGSPQLVIVSGPADAGLRGALERSHVAQRYPASWSFPAGGLGGGLTGLVRYLLYREPAVAPATQEFVVYLRRDLADKVLFKADAAGGTAPGTTFNLLDRVGRGRGAGQFDAPRGIAVDRHGSIFVVDTVNTRLQKFDAQGAFQWTVGGAGNGPSQFARVQNGPGPTGIAVDNQGSIYVADTWNHRIVKLDPQGKFLTAWGGFFNTQGNADLNRQHPRDFYGPRGLAVGPDGALYVTDTGNKRILVFDAEGQFLRQWGSAGAGAENLNEPVGIAVDAAGTVYVVDTFNGRIATFDPQGQPKAQWAVPNWAANTYQEAYIALAGELVYVTSASTRSLLTFDKTGKLIAEERKVGGVDLINPTGIAVAPDGSLYVVDSSAHAVIRTDKKAP